MRSEDAIRVLRDLEQQSAGELGKQAAFHEWRSKCLSMIRAAFGATAEQVTDFQRAVLVKNEGYVLTGAGRTEESWRTDAANRGRGVLRACIFTLETLSGESPLDEASMDPELWVHVQGLIADEDWTKIPAAVAIFVEDKVRRWAGDPRQSNGAVTVGKSLYAIALNNSGPLRLGGQESESEGWRSLGTGLAQALGNVDRHRIQRRSDAKRYAMGVLGLGSLLLTQLRYEHPARVEESEAVAEAETQAAVAESPTATTDAAAG
jgi:hypothetical protein